ncbi:MAG TPA: hypothetical protein DCG53_00700 [Syntrophus sp. (in: bacteria)]|nr:hypothetical protein [Syntrophus sp. (in: bacteria)]
MTQNRIAYIFLLKHNIIKQEVEMCYDHADLGQIELTIPANMSFLHIATETARHYALMVGFPEEDIYKIVLSVEETIANIISHSFVERKIASSFDIYFSISDPFGILIRIDDKGMPFDPSKAPHYDPDQALADMQISGLGLQLVRGMMDSVEYRNMGREGKSTLLIKYCPAPFHTKESAGRLWASSEESNEDSLVPLELTVRRLQPEEAIEVSRCAYKSHGYTFFNDIIYYPEKIREWNEKDLMISAVAVTDRNELIGHGALLLSEPGARIGEVTFVFVDEKYRQHNCLSRITEFIAKTAMEKNMAGFYSYSVTVHVISQKAAIRVGARPLAILLATTPMTWEFKGIVENLTQRISVVLFYRYVHHPNPRRIYPPAHHDKIIRQLYSTLGATHMFEKAVNGAPENDEEKSVIDTEIAEVENTAEIWIFRAGRDIDRELRNILRKLCTGGITSVALLVSIEDQTAQRYTEAFEGMGFFFAGILPETPIGDALILQYLNNIDFDYASVKILPGETESLLNYIRASDPNMGK